MKHEYLFEALLEEIPAWMLPSRLAMLRDGVAAVIRSFTGGEPEEDAILAGATSRRIWFRIAALPERQADREEEVKGPPQKSAYDASGAPTKALLGFLKKNGAEAAQVAVRDDYVWLRRTVPGLAATDVLQREIPRIVEGIRWPKMMRWGNGDFSYIRPLHSIVSLYGGTHLPLSIFGIASGTATRGHRILANESVEIASYDDYVAKLRAAHVVVSADERIAAMHDRCTSLAAEIGGTPAADDSIWEQWSYLTEDPGIVRAEFNREYLTLPDEVLTTVMRVHQKQLPIYVNGKLSNALLAVMDHDADPDGNAASGNAFVCNARFADAKFFYEADRRHPLRGRLDMLEHLQFQEKLGSYREKTRRIVSVAAAIHEKSGSRVDAANLAAAAEICKCDLVTEMVKEFTDLQGQIGGIYAREEGLPEDVWSAVYDHYKPSSVDGDVPRNESGAIVSMSDKLDTLCGFFAIGQKPTGSKDPFALRRAAQGIVQILLHRDGWKIDLGIDALIDAGLEGYYGHLSDQNRDQIRHELRDFFAERVRTLLGGAPYEFAYDEIAAAMEAGWTDSLLDLEDRVRALAGMRNARNFLSILDSAKRIANITAGAPATAIQRALLQEPAEKRLAELAQLVGEHIDELISERKYSAALESFAGMAPELETFFNEVLVMADDETLRANRMALLRKVGTSVGRIAEVTRIVVDRRDYNPAARQ